MSKKFNVTGLCIPEENYMVDISEKIDEIISGYVHEGKYFTINRARQYGKTTTLYLLEQHLKERYLVIRLSFEAADELFVSLYLLAAGLIRRIGRVLKAQGVDQTLVEAWNQPVSECFLLDDFSERINALCSSSEKKIVLIIDEVDKNSDNQIFLSFLGLLRNKYLEQKQGNDHTFWSVILAGVYDVKNLKLKLHPGQESKYNSPWNIAADFTVNMSFMPNDIATMLLDEVIARRMDFGTKASAWTKNGLTEAVKELLTESNTLFDDMVKKLDEYPELKRILYMILFRGEKIPYNADAYAVNVGIMFGFLKNDQKVVVVSNRIFETRMYDMFMSEEILESRIYKSAALDREDNC